MLYKEVFNRGPKLYPNKLAIIDGSRRLTYKEIGERNNRLANALVDLGMKKGERLGMVLKNCAEFIECHAASAKVNCMVGGINYRMAAAGMKNMITDLSPRVLVVHHEYADTINAIRNQLPFVQTYISVGAKVEGMLEYEDLISKYSTLEPGIPSLPDDLAGVIYTTGTTGTPKGAIASRQCSLNRICNSVMMLGFNPSDRYLQVFPIFHVGFYIGMGPIFKCGTVALMRDWDPKEFCEIVHREKINQTNLAPVTLNMVLNLPGVKKYDLSSLELIQYGASSMPHDVMERAVKLLPNCKFIQGYGSSETFCPVYLRPEEHHVTLGGLSENPMRRTACGRQGPLSFARVVNEQGEDVKPGEIGEILLSGNTIMTGYLNKPKETEEALKDGWYYTKDLGTLDEEGFISIVDRKNFMIITGGENVFPAQVENVLFSHPKIKEAAVLGIPDAKWGEAVKAFVVLKSGETATGEEIVEFCKPRMANYAKPKIIDFIDEIPKTTTGKMDKMALKALA